MKTLNTKSSQLKALKEKGRFVTFKSKNSLSETRGTSQVLVERFIKKKDGKVKIEGLYTDSIWFNSEDDLINAVDWDFMRAAEEISSIRD